ncbi:MAG: phosphoribosylformylglycinamidine synthase [Clostridiales bacterium]|nr:phosphoribosylformylglycinamidine synthase [Clostridiales bacterium]
MSQLKRYFVERREGFQSGAEHLCETLRRDLNLRGLTAVRRFVRYDLDTVPETHVRQVMETILSEPFTDCIYTESLPETVKDGHILAVEALPGQYDQRADSCAQCVELVTGLRPMVKTAMVYVFYGQLTAADQAALRHYLINPVEAREAALDKPDSLETRIPPVEPVAVIDGFTDLAEADLPVFIDRWGLAMDAADLAFMQDYFKKEGRNPTETELRVIDTYWSDHCRHTTFNTRLTDIAIERPEVQAAYETYRDMRRDVYGDKEADRPITLMDLGTLAGKYLKKHGLIDNLDESEEINACSVKIDVATETGSEPWLYMFKNETHNHPTEIEPFGGAATCLGGAIRDPLSGRSYVYQSLRLTGAADPRKPLAETLPGKLPQRRICTLAADGFSSYGNQIGLATGIVDEVYHPGYEAKRMEVGAVVAAAPADQVVRKVPEPGNIVVLIGGRTGRDGCGGATGSSKTHTEESLETSGSEVQKGNPVEERKIQRLFRNPDVARAILRCNDFGAGGVSVAIGELADGVHVNLDAVPKKYEGLNGTELAISESQERMACVIARENWDMFAAACENENLEATVVAEITAEPRLVLDWQGQAIVDLSRAFVDSAGAPKSMTVRISEPAGEAADKQPFAEQVAQVARDLNTCGKIGLTEQFDASIGAGTVLFPLGGKTQRTPIQTMAGKIPVLTGETDTTSLFAYGFNPYAMAADPFKGAYAAVVEAVTKVIATGTSNRRIYLSLQEYFHSLRTDPERWGQPFQAVLGALLAQYDMSVAAIGGKDSMSGSFEELDVPPTLVAFATAVSDAKRIISPEFKAAGHQVALFHLPQAEGRIDRAAFREAWAQYEQAVADGSIVAAWAVTHAGAAEGLFKMTLGNQIGVSLSAAGLKAAEQAQVGSIILELAQPFAAAEIIGETTDRFSLQLPEGNVDMAPLSEAWTETLAGVYPIAADQTGEAVVPPVPTRPVLTRRIPPIAVPRAVVPVFPGSNCEYDTARALERAGAKVETVLVANLTPRLLDDSVLRMEEAIRRAQIMVFPGGFSFGDEPDGSGKYIAAFFREPRLAEALHSFLDDQDGLLLGICNGFQALVKLGLLPHGRITPPADNDCTLTFNAIGRHQSRYVHTRIASNASPWLQGVAPGDVHAIPISHGEGRFMTTPERLRSLMDKGQIATQYCNAAGMPQMTIADNPNGAICAIEGLISADGRILGKMGHSERIGSNIAKNIPGNKDQHIFESGVRYFTD